LYLLLYKIFTSPSPSIHCPPAGASGYSVLAWQTLVNYREFMKTAQRLLVAASGILVPAFLAPSHCVAQCLGGFRPHAAHSSCFFHPTFTQDFYDPTDKVVTGRAQGQNS
jgi:hypothetical protein